MRKETTYFTVVVILISPSLPARVRGVANYKINYYRATIRVPENEHIQSLRILSKVPGFRKTPLEQRKMLHRPPYLSISPISAPDGLLFWWLCVADSQLWDCSCFSFLAWLQAISLGPTNFYMELNTSFWDVNRLPRIQCFRRCHTTPPFRNTAFHPMYFFVLKSFPWPFWQHSTLQTHATAVSVKLLPRT